MGVFQLFDELQRVIERQVAAGKAASAAAFLEDAVMRLVEEATREGHALLQVIETGSADFAGSRYTTPVTPQDEQRLHDGMMDRPRVRVSHAG